MYVQRCRLGFVPMVVVFINDLHTRRSLGIPKSLYLYFVQESNKAMMYSDTGLLNCNRAVQLFLLPFLNWVQTTKSGSDLRLPVII
ncbi:hypothetical protein MKW98_026590 [Papaver atlanticum]|uniref:Uncharacterized protein n=1 Tax=Papaver atlanticum TaxID=357466 RepID=A0AAD4X5H8_9MAGN|nr:hypothetical protein MKW98_026590 [Papaver atlanticum]